jgi:hypothetical protein
VTYSHVCIEVNSGRNPNTNGLEVEALSEACQLPSQLTVGKCEAHTSRTDKIAISHRKADKMAKAAGSLRESVREPYVYIVVSLR